MSTNSNDPFTDPNPNAAPGINQGNVAYAEPQQKKSRTGLLIGCGLASLLGLIVCCGGFSMLGYVGMGAVAELIQALIHLFISHFGNRAPEL